MAEIEVIELCRLVSVRLRAFRLEQRVTQADLAKASGIALRTYRRLEATGQGSIESLFAVMKATGRATAISVLFPEPVAHSQTPQERIRKYAFAPRTKRKRI